MIDPILKGFVEAMIKKDRNQVDIYMNTNTYTPEGGSYQDGRTGQSLIAAAVVTERVPDFMIEYAVKTWKADLNVKDNNECNALFQLVLKPFRKHIVMMNRIKTLCSLGVEVTTSASYPTNRKKIRPHSYILDFIVLQMLRAHGLRKKFMWPYSDDETKQIVKFLQQQRARSHDAPAIILKCCLFVSFSIKFLDLTGPLSTRLEDYLETLDQLTLGIDVANIAISFSRDAQGNSITGTMAEFIATMYEQDGSSWSDKEIAFLKTVVDLPDLSRPDVGIFFYIRAGRASNVAMILRDRSNVDVTNTAGQTPFEFALSLEGDFFNPPVIWEILIAMNPNEKDSSGDTHLIRFLREAWVRRRANPAQWYIFESKKDFFRTPDLLVKGRDGTTTLHWLACFLTDDDWKRVIAAYSLAVDSFDVVDNKGRTPLDFGREMVINPLAKDGLNYLESFGALSANESYLIYSPGVIGLF